MHACMHVFLSRGDVVQPYSLIKEAGKGWIGVYW